MPRLELSFLGSYQVKLDGELVTAFEADKVRLLLAYLAVESHQPHRREQLAAMFWPGWPDASARTSLRNALSNLRKAIGDETAAPAFLLIDRETIQFNPESSYTLDTLELERIAKDSHATIDQLQSVVSRYRGSFLEGFTLKDCPAFDDWSLAVREQCQNQAAILLSRLSELYEQDKAFEKAIDCARKRLSLEPWQEDAHRQLMRLLAASGQRPAALAQFETCKRLLKSELGVEPSAETQRLYESIRDSQPGEPAQVKAHPHNLPAQLTSFIGREQEIEQVKDLLKSHRLVTLTGSGGTGKTRLARQVATELLGRYPDGTWLAELAPLADPNFVPQAVATALNLPEMPGKRIIDSLVDYLHSKRLLLILDNCEHLLEACTSLADRLLRSCPELSILASSREFLGVKGEVPYRVPPMTLPDAHLLPPVEQLAEYDSVRLFVERARLVSSGFTVTVSNAAAIVHVVNRLDGIPLAIELAAARLRMLSVDQVALRLNDAFRLLTGGSRTVLPRHQTLRAMIDWSYNLLTEAERTLLRRLSVFAGSWVLEAAEQVCSLELEACLPLCPEDVFDLLAGLVDKSLVLPAQEGKVALRFRMLETIRQYAHEKLEDEKEAAAVRTRHLVFYLGLAEELGPKIRSHGQIQTLDHLELELDNLRLALEWALQTDLEAELRISAALHWFWQIREHFLEAIDWLERGLEAEKKLFTGASKGLDLSVRAKALASLGYHRLIKSFVSSDKANPMDEVTKPLEEALSLFRGLDAEHNPDIRRGLAWVLVYLGWQQNHIRNYDQAKNLGSEALDAFGEIGDQLGIAECLGILGDCEIDPARKMKLYQEKLAVGEAVGDIAGVAYTHGAMGDIALADGEYEKARKAYEVSKEIYRRISHPRAEADTLIWLGWCSLALDDLPGAEQYLQQSQAILYELGYTDEIVGTLFLQYMLRVAQGLYDQAAEMLETAWHIQQKLGSQMALERVLYMRASLARLGGNIALARKYVDELFSFTDLNPRLIARAKVEAGHLALQSGDIERAGFLYREGLQIIIRRRVFVDLVYPLDGLARVAIQENKQERATRLMGTRWCRGFYHFLAPPEREQRKNYLASIRANLGEERFEQLYEQGRMLSLQQALALALEG